MNPPRPVRRGERPRAADHNALVDAITGERLVVQAPITSKASGDGYALGMEFGSGRPIFAKLSGAAGTGTSPYSWQERKWNSSTNAWVTPVDPLSGTSDAYELNALASLGGKVVPLYRAGEKDWLFRFNRFLPPAPPPPPCVQKLCVTVAGCGSFKSGVGVVIKQGGTTVLGPTNTDANGQVCWPLPANGSYTATVVAPFPAHMTTGSDPLGSSTVNFTINGCIGQTLHLFIYPDSTHVCACWGFTSLVCDQPMPLTLTMSDEHSTITLTATSTPNASRWRGSYTYSEPNAAYHSTDPYIGGCCFLNPQVCTVVVELTCFPFGLTRSIWLCPDCDLDVGFTYNCPPPAPAAKHTIYQTDMSNVNRRSFSIGAPMNPGGTCTPMNMTFNFPANLGHSYWDTQPVVIPGMTGGFATVTG